MSSVTLLRLAGYFLRLGATGFGGPVALANHMHRDLVETRGWISEAEYADGLALATACPGPLAYQLGVYLGYVRFGLAGALAVALAFAFAPFLIVSLIAALYVRFAGAWELRALFYGIGPVIVALILKASWQLGRKTLKRRWSAWTLAAVAAAVTAVRQQELVGLFIAAGLLGTLLFATPAAATPPQNPPAAPRSAGLVALGLAGATSPAWTLFLFFFKTGLLVFGSGLVIAPFLKAYVVDQYHWLDDRQFIDALAVGMITPGPVVITATFVGYLLDGFAGAAAATAGIFAPAVLVTAAAAPLLQRYRSHPRVQGFVQGIVAAVVGALFGTTLLVATAAVRDWPTAVIGLTALAVVWRLPKLSDAVLVLGGAVLGLALHFFLPSA